MRAVARWLVAVPDPRPRRAVLLVKPNDQSPLDAIRRRFADARADAPAAALDEDDGPSAPYPEQGSLSP